MVPIPDSGLPIEGSIVAVREALTAEGHAVVVAPPGSGKTTIVPLRLLESLNGDRKILVLEPRRLATRAAARRMADLLGEDVGATVGYVTRDDRRVSASTRIEVVTEGVLTRRIQRDPSLQDVALVVFDEFHERNLQTDLGLALILDSRQGLRPDLRILIMSATLDAQRVATLMARPKPAPIVAADAGMFPVDIRWRPLPRRARLEQHVASIVLHSLAVDEGDLLVFLPGIGEIRRVEKALLGCDATVLPLHGSLPIDVQDRAIAPSRERKVVLSTDIAETSLTVEGIRIVVDSGLARAPRFDARSGMSRLKTVTISKASAEQRTGRAGRLAPGVGYRLWSKLEHGGRKPHIEPEITQVDLAGLALEIAEWGATSVESLGFLDPPPRRSWQEAQSLLRQLGAVGSDGRLTATGKEMVGLPVHPRLARMVIDAGEHRWLACVLATLIEDRDILRGHPDDLPVDIGERVRLVVDGEANLPQADRRSVDRSRRSAVDLARRSQSRPGPANVDERGRLLALAFADRLAMRRGSPGRFQLRTGTTAWIREHDPLAIEPFLIACDLDGKRKDARIRLGAPIDPSDVAAAYSDEVSETTELRWEGDRLVERLQRSLGGIALDLQDRRPAPGRDTQRAIIDRLRANQLEDLSWTQAARALQDRVGFARAQAPDDWPDWSTETLGRSLDAWLAAPLATATGLDDIRTLDVGKVLRSRLTHAQLASLDRLAPAVIQLPSGSSVRLDYTTGRPVLAVKVQELFGTSATPQVAGEPVLLHLLSPAGRPLQITADLASFWQGSWSEVRKEMVGRYPKHRWPTDPANAKPGAK